MIWAILIVGVVLLAIGVNEWRTRKKPLASGMREWEKGKHNESLVLVTVSPAFA